MHNSWAYANWQDVGAVRAMLGADRRETMAADAILNGGIVFGYDSGRDLERPGTPVARRN